MEEKEIKKPIKVTYPQFDKVDIKEWQEALNKITDECFINANTTRTLKNIRETLDNNLSRKYGLKNGERKAIEDEILSIHGIREDNFDFLAKFSDFINNPHLNSTSIDDNANKTERNMKGVLAEIALPISKLIGYDYLYRVMCELYGKEKAKELSGSMYDFSLAINDSTGIMSPYCYCMDASKLVTVGRDFGKVHSRPAQRLATYISTLGDTIRELSFNLMGALAIGTFFLDSANLLIYKERIPLQKLKEDKIERKRISNLFQQFIYTVNHYSRNATESPFTNISCFDHDKLKNLIGPDNYAWYFQKKTQVLVDNDLGGEEYKITYQEWEEFIIDYIMTLQEIFIDVFDKGDPLQGGLQFPFPVTTCLPGNELLVLNDKLTTFGKAFAEYSNGWTDVSKNELYTQHLGKLIKINKVFKGNTKKLIKLISSTMDEIIITPDHKFKMLDGTYKLAKDLCVKDRLLTYNNPINYTINKEYIKVSDYLNDLWVLGYKIKYSKESADYIQKINLCRGFDENTHSMNCNTNQAHPLKLIENCDKNWVTKFPKYDFIRTKESKNKAAIPNKIYLDENFGRFLGLYYAEGHNSNGELGISLNKNESELIKFVQNYLKTLNIKSKVRYWNNNKGCQIIFYNQTFGQLLDILINKYSYGKKLHDTLLFNTSINFRKNILRGLIEGDGYCNEYQCRLNTISYNGAKSIMYLATSLGIRSKINTSSVREIQDEIISKHIMYEIIFNKYDIIKYNYNLGKTNNFINTKYNLNTKGFYITNIEYIDTNEPVYNIEVDSKEHLYTLPNGIVTSNCNISIEIKDGKRKVVQPNRLLNYITKKDISRYNIYDNEGTKMASCCLAATTKILYRINNKISYGTVHQLYDIINAGNNEKVEIMGYKGFIEVIKAFEIKNPINELIKITLKNGLVISTTKDHPSVKIDKNGNLIELKAEELQINDILPVSKEINYESNGGSKELGRFVGLFGAEGQFDNRRSSSVSFCFHTQETDLQKFVSDFSLNNFGCKSRLDISPIYENSCKVEIQGNVVHGLMKDFFIGELCTEKRLKSRIFNMSEDFRLGFLEGFIEGDGYTKDNTRSDYGSIHIANKELAHDLVALANSINIKCSIRKGSNGNDYIVNILHNDKLKLKPLSDWHNGKGSKQKSTVLNNYDKYYGVEIDSIEVIKTKKDMNVYDFTVSTDDHLFQIANGIITHNCRLLSDPEEFKSYASSVNSFGGSSVSLGSCRVVTLNFHRAACEATNYDHFKQIIDKRCDNIAKILKAQRLLVLKMTNKGLHPFISNGWINFNRMFGTFGCIGYLEADQLLKMKFGNETFDYMKDFMIYFNQKCNSIFQEKDEKGERIYQFPYNIEQIPGESMAPKLAKVDYLIFNNKRR